MAPLAKLLRTALSHWGTRLAALLGVFFVFAFLKVEGATKRAPKVTGDGHVWRNISEADFFSRGFFYPRRPIALPLIYKLFAPSDEGLVWLNVLLACFAWGFLAWAAGRLARSTLIRALIFVGVLLLAMVTPVTGWDGVIRSESTSHSFFVLALGCTLLLADLSPIRRDRSLGTSGLAAFGIFLSALAVFSRDTFPYLVAPMGLIPALVFFSVRENRWRAGLRAPLGKAVTVYACALIAVSALAQGNAKAAVRYEFPLMNTIFQRVLPKPDRVAYFEKKLGMPVTPTLMTRTGKWGSSDKRFAFSANPEMEAFRKWLRKDGFGAYQTFLLAHPRETVSEALGASRDVLAYDARDTPGTRYSRELDRWLVRPLAKHMTALCLLIGALSSVSVLRRKETLLLGLLGLFCALGAFTQLILGYHGDAMEVQRHSLMVGILLRLGVLFALAQIPELFKWRRGRRAV